MDYECIADADNAFQKNRCMGGYNLERFESVDENTYQIYRGCNSTGVATVEKHLFSRRDNNIKIERKRVLNLGHTSSLSDFQYLTDSENAGGHPWVFEPAYPCIAEDGHVIEENRRDVTFGAGDVMNLGWGGGPPTCDVGFKTNGTFVMSNYGAPIFNITVSVIDNGDGTYNSPEGPTQGGNVFQGDPQLDTVKTTCLPPPGYEQMKRVIEYSDDHLLLDATTKLKYQPNFSQRDTLIMTEIEFFTDIGNSGFHVKQWWYLMPPYIDDFGPGGFDSPNSNPFQEFPMARPSDLGFSSTTPGQCSNSMNLTSCDRYKEMMALFHNTRVTDSGSELGMDALATADDDIYHCSRGNTGFKHFDVPEIFVLYESLDECDPNCNSTWRPDWISQFEIDRRINSTWETGSDGIDDHLLREYVIAGGRKTYYYTNPTAIYVKGGPVRVKGEYEGRYTIVTDEYQPYRRHAWGMWGFPPNSNPIDTLWTDIFITDDLLNADANGSSLLNAQPDEACSEGTGSDNRLGLVSGANIYVANTIENGARSSEISYCNLLNDDNANESYISDRRNIVIHAHMIAFNESFAGHYSNNTYNNGNADYNLTAQITDFNGLSTVTYTAGSLGAGIPFIDFGYIEHISGVQSNYTSLLTSTGVTNGTITLTKLDLSNLVVSGSFSFIGYNVSNQSDVMDISNGTFQDVPFEITQ